MKCEKCGFENSEQDLYCIQCGNKLERRVQPGNKSKLPIIILVIALLIGGGAGGYYFLHKDKNTNDYPALIAKADEYLENEDYDQAIATYLEAIKVEPKEVKPYIQLANIYVIQEDYDKAIDILDQAKDAIGEDNTEINDKYDEVKEMYKESNIQSMYQAYYKELTELENTYGTCEIDDTFGKEFVGTIYAKLADMDNDGLEEMVVLVNSKDEYEVTLYIFSYDTDHQQVIKTSYITNSNSEISYVNSYTGIIYFCLSSKDDLYYITSNGYEGANAYTKYYILDENKELTIKQTFEMSLSNSISKIDGKTVDWDEYNEAILEYEEVRILITDESGTSFDDIEGNGFVDPQDDLQETKELLAKYQ